DHRLLPSLLLAPQLQDLARHAGLDGFRRLHIRAARPDLVGLPSRTSSRQLRRPRGSAFPPPEGLLEESRRLVSNGRRLQDSLAIRRPVATFSRVTVPESF